MPTGPYSGLRINSARRVMTAQFSSSGRDGSDIAARAILEHITGLSPAQQIIHGAQSLTPEQIGELSNMAARYAEGEPLDNILGWREFWKDRFIVSKDVLSPRPETEGLIELAIQLFKTKPPARILDLGTGSGAILLSLLREFPQAQALGVDISNAALNVAKQNAKALGLKAKFAKGSWFDTLDRDACFDLIVSNPPYIDAKAMANLPREVAEFDPNIALSGGQDGLDAYRKITTSAPSFLTAGGVLIVEIGYDQGASVSALFKLAGLSEISVTQDLSGHDRIVSGVKP